MDAVLDIAIITPGSSHDGIEPLRRSVRRVIDMHPVPDGEAAFQMAAEQALK